MKLNENTKITLTIHQIKAIIKESFEYEGLREDLEDSENIDLQPRLPNHLKTTFDVIVLKDGVKLDVNAKIEKINNKKILYFVPAEFKKSDFKACDKITAGDITCFPKEAKLFESDDDLDEPWLAKTARASLDVKNKTLTFNF